MSELPDGFEYGMTINGHALTHPAAVTAPAERWEDPPAPPVIPPHVLRNRWPARDALPTTDPEEC